MPLASSLWPLFVFLPERLDLDVDAGGEIELHQGVDRLRGRLEDVDQPLVRTDLELLTRLLVDVGRTEHRPLVDFRRQRDRTRQARAGPLRGLDDLARRLIEHAIVVRLQADADLVAEHGHAEYLSASGCRLQARRAPEPDTACRLQPVACF